MNLQRQGQWLTVALVDQFWGRFIRDSLLLCESEWFFFVPDLHSQKHRLRLGCSSFLSPGVYYMMLYGSIWYMHSTSHQLSPQAPEESGVESLGLNHSSVRNTWGFNKQMESEEEKYHQKWSNPFFCLFVPVCFGSDVWSLTEKRPLLGQLRVRLGCRKLPEAKSMGKFGVSKIMNQLNG